MKFIHLTDLHYGCNHNTHKCLDRFFKQKIRPLIKNNPDCIIISGDIISHKQSQWIPILTMIRKYIPTTPILVVRGNHDLWRHYKDNVPGINNSRLIYNRRHKVLPVANYEDLTGYHRKIFNEYDIHWLEDRPWIWNDEIIVCGFDGWYGSISPPSNDVERMMLEGPKGEQIMPYLSNRAYTKLDNLINMDISKYRFSICVTHHAPYSTSIRWVDMCANLNYYSFIKDKFNMLCCGHNHCVRNDLWEGLYVLNPGSDYNRPEYIYHEVL